VYTRFALCGTLVLACARAEPAPSTSDAALMRSGDPAAVHDGGVAAYRAKDYARARRLWRRAADLGDPDAASNLGFLLYHGWGGPADSAGAEALWRGAMARGQAEAHRHAADAGAAGDGRFGGPADAYAHAVAAEVLALRPGARPDSGVARDARELTGRLGARLGPGERALAAGRGRAWAADTVGAPARAGRAGPAARAPGA
jgi:hypothetical protein